MSGSIAAVDVVIAEDRPGEFRRQEVHLVGGLRAAEDSGRLPAVLGEVSTEPFGRAIEGFVPGSGTENALIADQRLGEALIRARSGGAGLPNHVHLLGGIAVT